MNLKHKSLLVNNYDGIVGLEMNSSIKQRRVKKSYRNYLVLSVKSLKHNYESFAGIKSELLHGHF